MLFPRHVSNIKIYLPLSRHFRLTFSSAFTLFGAAMTGETYGKCNLTFMPCRLWFAFFLCNFIVHRREWDTAWHNGKNVPREYSICISNVLRNGKSSEREKEAHNIRGINNNAPFPSTRVKNSRKCLIKITRLFKNKPIISIIFYRLSYPKSVWKRVARLRHHR